MTEEYQQVKALTEQVAANPNTLIDVWATWRGGDALEKAPKLRKFSSVLKGLGAVIGVADIAVSVIELTRPQSNPLKELTERLDAIEARQKKILNALAKIKDQLSWMEAVSELHTSVNGIERLKLSYRAILERATGLDDPIVEEFFHGPGALAEVHRNGVVDQLTSKTLGGDRLLAAHRRHFGSPYQTMLFYNYLLDVMANADEMLAQLDWTLHDGLHTKALTDQVTAYGLAVAEAVTTAHLDEQGKPLFREHWLDVPVEYLRALDQLERPSEALTYANVSQLADRHLEAYAHAGAPNEAGAALDISEVLPKRNPNALAVMYTTHNRSQAGASLVQAAYPRDYQDLGLGLGASFEFNNNHVANVGIDYYYSKSIRAVKGGSHNSKNHQWFFMPVDNGLFYLIITEKMRGKAGTRHLGVSRGKLHVSDAPGAGNQHWRVYAHGGPHGPFSFMNRQTEQCLGLLGDIGVGGTPDQVWCQWWLRRV